MFFGWLLLAYGAYNIIKGFFEKKETYWLNIRYKLSEKNQGIIKFNTIFLGVICIVIGLVILL